MLMLLPPALERHRWFFRLLLIAALVYAFTAAKDKKADAPVTEQTASAPLTEDEKQQRKEEARLLAGALGAGDLITDEQREGDGEEEGLTLKLNETSRNWLERQLLDFAATEEGKAVVTALSEVALRKQAGTSDISLLGAKTSGKALSRDIVAGGGDTVYCGDTVTLNWRVLNAGNAEIDNTEALGAPPTAILGTGALLPALERHVPGMRAGGLRLIAAPSALMYENTGFTNMLARAGQPLYAEASVLSAVSPFAGKPVSFRPAEQEAEATDRIFCGDTVTAVFFLPDAPDDGAAYTFRVGKPDEEAPPPALQAALPGLSYRYIYRFTAPAGGAPEAFMQGLFPAETGEETAGGAYHLRITPASDTQTDNSKTQKPDL